MKKFLILIFLLSAIIFCNKSYSQESIDIKGTVTFISIEGGFYGIIGDDGEKYLPLSLPDEYKKIDMRISIKGKIRDDIMTTQQWGKSVEIVEIQKLSNDPKEKKKCHKKCCKE